MAETALNFGPEWLRALTTTTTSASNATSMPIQRHVLSKYRYGREEMLAFLPKEPQIPKSLRDFPDLLRETFQLPLALIPQTEEEQRLWSRSVNSEMAMRAKAGYRTSRGGSVDRGRGRGRGGNGHMDEGFTRSKVERSLSANEKEHRWEERDRRYDRPYIVQREDVRGPGDNWRKIPKDDDPDWRFSRSTGGRSWRREDRTRSTKWKDDSPQSNLPEWSVDETAEPDTLGTFDSSGAFLEKETNASNKEEINISDDADEGQDKSPEAKSEEKSPPKPVSSSKSPKSSPEKLLPSLPQQTNDLCNTGSEGGSPEEDAFAHHQKATENMVALWTEEIEDSPSKQPAIPPPQPHHDNEVHWFYQDPQGKIQGPFLSSDMLEWYNAGYFSLSLMVRRTFDEKFSQLGDLIDSWGRVPFLPGEDPPPPLRAEVPPKPQTNEQLLAIQQQLYQQQLVQQQLLLRQAQMQTLLAQLNKEDNFTSLNTQQQQQILMQQMMTQPQMPRHDMLDPLPLMGLTMPPLIKNNLWPPSWPPVNTISKPIPPTTGGSIWDMETPEKDEGSQSKLRRLAEKELQKKDESEELRRQQEEHQREEERKMLEELQRQREEERKRLEELKRIEEESERQRLEEIKKQQEEELRKKQEEIKKQEELRIEEELRKQEEEFRRQEERRKEQEELKKLEELRKKQEELKMQEELKREEELRKREELKKEEEFRKQEELRLQEEEQKRKQEEQRKQEELRKQEEKRKKEERMAALRQQEEERQKRHEEEEAERKKLAEIKIQKGPAWGAKNTQPDPPEMSLADIQKLQEEKEREEREERIRKQMLQQKTEKQVQQAKNKLSWAKRANDSQPVVKSLMEIQQEETERLAARMQHKPQIPSPPVNTNTGVWGNSSHINKITSSSNCISAGSGFWDDVPAPKKQPQPKTGNESAFPSLNNPMQHSVASSNKSKNVRAKRDEDAVTRLFGSHHKPTDEFTKWCTDAISAMPSSVDVPTFVAFLKDIDSPYEVYDYVKSYFGEGKEQREFAKLFLEKRSHFRNKAKQPPAEDNSLWGPAPAITPTTNKPTIASSGGSEGTSGGTKTKKRKNRMQRLDSSMLGFTVQSNPDRINVGEIDHAQ